MDIFLLTGITSEGDIAMLLLRVRIHLVLQKSKCLDELRPCLARHYDLIDESSFGSYVRIGKFLTTMDRTRAINALKLIAKETGANSYAQDEIDSVELNSETATHSKSTSSADKTPRTVKAITKKANKDNLSSR